MLNRVNTQKSLIDFMSIFGVNLLKYKLTFSSLDLGFTIDIKFNEYIWILGDECSNLFTPVQPFIKVQQACRNKGGTGARVHPIILGISI